MADETKKCPQCAEAVQAAAVVCRFCQYNFQTGQPGAPPPPPPASSNKTMMWVLIGCGGLLLVGGLVCGGCLYFGGRFINSAVQAGKEAEQTLRTHPAVVEEFGTLKSLEAIQDHQPAKDTSAIPMKFRVVGSKRTGHAIVTLGMEGTLFKLKRIQIEKEDGTLVDVK